MTSGPDHLSREFHPIFDDPRQWGSSGIWNPPTFDLAGYQKRIDRIVGTSDGKPIVRLVWAWHSLNRQFVEWDEFGRGIKAANRARYRFMTVHLPDGDEVDISVPRWILEQRYEPGQYWASWEATRYIADPLLAGRRKDIRGEPPADGWYGYLRTIAEHDENEECCDRAWNAARRRCWGYYRLPNDRDLEILAGAVALRDADPRRVNPHEPLPADVFDDLDRLAYAQAAKAEEKRIEVVREGLGDWLRTHGWRAFTEDPSVLKHGKWRNAFPSTILQ